MNNCLPILILLALFGDPTGQTIDTVQQKINKIAHKHVDVGAKFASGNFNSFIASHIAFHSIQENISGEVELLVKIESSGQLSEVTVLKGISPAIDHEVVNAVEASPAWTPAQLNGIPTDMEMILKVDMAIMGILAGHNSVTAAASQSAVNQHPQTAQAIPVKRPHMFMVTALPVALPAKKLPVSLALKAATPVHKAQIAVVPKPIPAKKQVVPPSVKPIVAIKPAIIQKKKEPVKLVAKPKPVLLTKSKPPVLQPPLPKPVVKPVVVAPQKPVTPVTVQPVVSAQTPVKVKTFVMAQEPKLAMAKPKTPAKPILPIIKAKTPIKPVLAANNATAKKVLKKAPNNKHKATDGDEAFVSQSTEAHFPGGNDAFFTYLSANLIYPESLKTNKIEGQVLVSFVIEADGTLSDITILKSTADDMSKEAIRILTNSPKWIPGEQNGNKAKQRFTIPINFKLKD